MTREEIIERLKDLLRFDGEHNFSVSVDDEDFEDTLNMMEDFDYSANTILSVCMWLDPCDEYGGLRKAFPELEERIGIVLKYMDEHYFDADGNVIDKNTLRGW